MQSLSQYFDEWLAEKEKYDLIPSVYSVNSIMAVVNFIQFIEDINKYSKEIIDGRFDRKSCG
jgi:hypothetical protein